jgi:hypothetical protein
VLATRADQRMADLVKARCADAECFPLPGAIRVWRDRAIHGKGKIAVVCAGASDIFAAGVAGIHRLMNNRGRLLEARVVVVRAGMEGALPGVVGGLASAPVTAVPASVGLRGQLPRSGGALGHAQQLRRQRNGGEHRQRLRRGVCSQPDQPAVRGRVAGSRATWGANLFKYVQAAHHLKTWFTGSSVGSLVGTPAKIITTPASSVYFRRGRSRPPVCSHFMVGALGDSGGPVI